MGDGYRWHSSFLYLKCAKTLNWIQRRRFRGALLFAFAMYILHYFRRVRRRPELFYCTTSPWTPRLVEKCRVLHHSYAPPLFLFSRHLQLLYGAMIVPWVKKHLLDRMHKWTPWRKRDSQYDLSYRRDLLRLDDGGTVSLDWAVLPGGSTSLGSAEAFQPKEMRTIVILHGLTGGSEGYEQLCSLGVRNDWQMVVFNRRGHSMTSLSAPRLSAFGDHTDFVEVAQHLSSRIGGAPLYAIGVSAGSGLLAGYLGECGGDSVLKGGVCVCPGYNLRQMIFGTPLMSAEESDRIRREERLETDYEGHYGVVDHVLKQKGRRESEKMSRSMDTGRSGDADAGGGGTTISCGVGMRHEELTFQPAVSPTYDRVMMANMKHNVLRHHRAVLEQHVSWEEVLKHDKWTTYERTLGYRLYGYRTLDDYFSACDPMRAIARIRVPVLVLSALDDPICDKANIPFRLFESHPYAVLATTPYGSHTMYLESTWFKGDLLSQAPLSLMRAIGRIVSKPWRLPLEVTGFLFERSRWGDRAALEYLQSLDALLQEQRNGQMAEQLVEGLIEELVEEMGDDLMSLDEY